MSRGRFRREKKLIELNFDDSTGLDGFECIMASVSLDKLLSIARLTSAMDRADGRTPENIEKLFSTIGALLVEWNLDDDEGNPVPATYDGLKVQELPFAQAILAGYMQALSSVPKALKDVSLNGGQLAGLDGLPMEALSPNPPS